MAKNKTKPHRKGLRMIYINNKDGYVEVSGKVFSENGYWGADPGDGEYFPPEPGETPSDEHDD